MLQKEIYKVFTLIADEVTHGAPITPVELKGAGVTIATIGVGEVGRGRQRAFLPVGGVEEIRDCPNRGKVPDLDTKDPLFECGDCGKSWRGIGQPHPDSGLIPKDIPPVQFAEVTQTRSGRPKLLSYSYESSMATEKAIVVLRTPIGYRGGNQHCGDLIGRDEEDRPTFKDFPGEVLAEGIIAQGDAGRMGDGEQLIAVMPRDVVFTARLFGRLYGNPSRYYYYFDGQKVLALTVEEREISELF